MRFLVSLASQLAAGARARRAARVQRIVASSLVDALADAGAGTGPS